MNLTDLFPDENYQFKLRFERGGIADYYRATDQHEALVSQRREWLTSSPSTYAALLPEGIPLLKETVELAKELGTLGDMTARIEAAPQPWDLCLALGEIWEPDFLLLKPDAQGEFKLLGGCVCFPSSWALSEKIGQPLEFIHGVVPGLNVELGRQITGFLKKIRPGVSWERMNWGLSRSPELNHHPERRLPRLDARATLEQVWLRIEHQSLAALPQNQGILFGIRLEIYSLAGLKSKTNVVRRLCRALVTMPEAMASYKNLAEARYSIVKMLGD